MTESFTRESALRGERQSLPSPRPQRIHFLNCTREDATLQSQIDPEPAKLPIPVSCASHETPAPKPPNPQNHLKSPKGFFWTVREFEGRQSAFAFDRASQTISNLVPRSLRLLASGRIIFFEFNDLSPVI